MISNFIKEQKKYRETIVDEVMGNEAIIDEIVNIQTEMKRFGNIVNNILVFEYLTTEKNAEYIKEECKFLDMSYVHLMCLIDGLVDKELSVDYPKTVIEDIEMFRDKVAMLERENKNRILFRIKGLYPSLYERLLERAECTTQFILGAVNDEEFKNLGQ